MATQLPTYPAELNFKFADKKIGDIITSLLPYVFVFSGLLVLLYLIMGGFQLMTSAGDPKKTEQAKGKITGAILGFLIIFVSFWIAQIFEYIFGVREKIF